MTGAEVTLCSEFVRVLITEILLNQLHTVAYHTLSICYQKQSALLQTSSHIEGETREKEEKKTNEAYSKKNLQPKYLFRTKDENFSKSIQFGFSMRDFLAGLVVQIMAFFDTQTNYQTQLNCFFLFLFLQNKYNATINSLKTIKQPNKNSGSNDVRNFRKVDLKGSFYSVEEILYDFYYSLGHCFPLFLVGAFSFKEKSPTITVASFFFFRQTTELIAYVPLFTETDKFTQAKFHQCKLTAKGPPFRILPFLRNLQNRKTPKGPPFQFFSALCEFFSLCEIF